MSANLLDIPIMAREALKILYRIKLETQAGLLSIRSRAEHAVENGGLDELRGLTYKLKSEFECLHDCLRHLRDCDDYEDDTFEDAYHLPIHIGNVYALLESCFSKSCTPHSQGDPSLKRALKLTKELGFRVNTMMATIDQSCPL